MSILKSFKHYNKIITRLLSLLGGNNNVLKYRQGIMSGISVLNSDRLGQRASEAPSLDHTRLHMSPFHHLLKLLLSQTFFIHIPFT